jgi:hypothetical protein
MVQRCSTDNGSLGKYSYLSVGTIVALCGLVLYSTMGRYLTSLPSLGESTLTSLVVPSRVTTAVDSSQPIEESHLYYDGMAHNYNVCTADEILIPGTTIEENAGKTLFIAHIEPGKAYRSQLCLAHNHGHTHSIAIRALEDTSSDSHCVFYFSTKSISPSSSRWDWKAETSLSPSLTIYTYMPEFTATSNHALYIGGYAKDPTREVTCTIEVSIAAYDNMKLLSRSSLRGGQVLLPRDVKDVISSDRIL